MAVRRGRENSLFLLPCHTTLFDKVLDGHKRNVCAGSRGTYDHERESNLTRPPDRGHGAEGHKASNNGISEQY